MKLKGAKRIGWLIALPLLLVRFVFVLLIIPCILGAWIFFHQGSTVPKASDAPWAIQTFIYTDSQAIPSRIYYGKTFQIINGEAALVDYWDYNGKKYNEHNSTLVFVKKEWGAVSIIRRVE